MPRRSIFGSLIDLTLDRESGEPMHRQLHLQIRNAILDGRLRPGLPLPSTRTLADELECSRTTVLATFEQLLSEGYLAAQVGSGTKVADWLPEELLRRRNDRHSASRPFKSKLSARGDRLCALLPPRRVQWPAFTPNEPDVESFPMDLWLRLVNRCWRDAPTYRIRNDDPAGFLGLREAIATYVAVGRGLVCSPDQVFVTNGTRHSIDLAVRLVTDPGDKIVLEDPGFPAMRKVAAAGGVMVPVPVDGEGLRIDELQKRAPDARLAIVTPTRQFPLGPPMSLPRRLELLDWAARNDAWIIEDDYDSEYRYTGPPLSALQTLDESGRVIYMNSFSKMLFPSLRLGFLIVPYHLVETFRQARSLLDYHPPIFLQPVLAEFIEEGHLAARVRTTREMYRERQAALIEAVRAHAADLLHVEPADSGLALVARLSAPLLERMDDTRASALLAENNLTAPPLSEYYVENEGRVPGLLLGYAAVTPEEIVAAVQKMASVLRR